MIEVNKDFNISDNIHTINKINNVYTVKCYDNDIIIYFKEAVGKIKVNNHKVNIDRPGILRYYNNGIISFNDNIVNLFSWCRNDKYKSLKARIIVRNILYKRIFKKFRHEKKIIDM